MSKNATSCSRVSDGINCSRCKEKKVVKNGRTKNNKQQYYFKICLYRFIENYIYISWLVDKYINVEPTDESVKMISVVLDKTQGKYFDLREPEYD